MPPSFNPTKPVQTRDGRPVRILATDRRHCSGQSIVGLIYNNINNHETLSSWSPNGVHPGEHECDLVNVPVKHTRWLNLYHGTTAFLYKSREEADREGTVSRIACIKVEFTESEGL